MHTQAWRAYVAHLARGVAKRHGAELYRMETILRPQMPHDDEYRLLFVLPNGSRLERSFDAETLAAMHERDGEGLAAFVEEQLERALRPSE